MGTWSTAELERIGDAQEMYVSGRRHDGSLRRPVIVWMVRRGGDLYLYTRSVNGPEASWFRGTQQQHEGHISAGGVEIDVAFIDVDETDSTLQDNIDAAYRAKYRRYRGPTTRITSDVARSATVKLEPRRGEREN